MQGCEGREFTQCRRGVARLHRCLHIRMKLPDPRRFLPRYPFRHQIGGSRADGTTTRFMPDRVDTSLRVNYRMEVNPVPT